MALIDRFGRHIDYLRISITDNCNLNCRYCMPELSGRQSLKKSDILSFEELLKLAEAAVASGISKIRITGGEPLVRKGVVDLCGMLGGLRGLNSLALTTNGVKLSQMASELKEAGVDRINISLDTLQRQRFRELTGKDWLPKVLTGIRRAAAAGFSPVKINTVVMRGFNEDEIPQLAALTYDHPYHVRFIELMPFQGRERANHADLYMPVGEIVRKIPHIDKASVGSTFDTNGPARLCTLPGAKGKVGFIAPLSWHFCGGCNRLRLTADGKIRNCLFSDEEIDLKQPLRRGASTDELAQIFRHAVDQKPRRHHLSSSQFHHQRRNMHAIGG